ncbi:hypothetical protein GUJ93_ZPchr0007g3668 [Zizania palustris]|uniref:Uncharacterized protein n=1 Tax=Zizania palustris TaxID=103762 RepID=A0A8J5SVD3_ZIZPA|nr:hypothetical protein GUJ93_ZPchr0007g3668 [Zizania palustris]
MVRLAAHVSSLLQVSLVVVLLLFFSVHVSDGRHDGMAPPAEEKETYIAYNVLRADGVPGRRHELNRVGPASNIYHRGCESILRCRGAA